MNKLFTKVAALTLGVAMAAGVGVAVGASQKASAADAAQATITSSQFTAVDNSSTDQTVSGIRFELENGTINSSELRLFKGKSLKITAPANNLLTSVKITCTASGTSKYGPGCMKAMTGYSYSGTVGTWTGSESNITFTSDTNQVRITQFVVDYEPEQTDEPKISLSKESLNFIENDSAAAVTVTPNSAFTDVPTISVEGTPAYVDVAIDGLSLYVLPKAVGNETVTIKATNDTQVATATFTVKVVPSHGRSAEDPYTVPEVIAAIDAEYTTFGKVYVTGIVSSVEIPSEFSGSLCYYISADGTTTAPQFKIYWGKGLNNQNFTSADDVQVGATIVNYGAVTKYNSEYEFSSGSYLISYESSGPELTSVEISGSASAVAGKSWNYDSVTVTGHYSDQSTKDIKEFCTIVIEETPVETMTSATVKVTYKDQLYTETITVSVSPAPAAKDFQKITSTSELADGKYLIVFEDSGSETPAPLTFDSSLETLDAVSNTVSVTVADSKINISEDEAFEIKEGTDGYTIKSSSGYYIGQTSDANGLQASKTVEYKNGITFDENGNANISSSGAFLRYNDASNQVRFRYYKSASYTGQKPIALYKVYEAPTPTLESIAVSGEYKTEYGYQAEEFDKEGIVVTATYSDQSQQSVDLKDVEFSGYNKSFLGEQTVTVTYQEKTTTFNVTVYYTATYKPGEGTSEDGDYVEYIKNPDNYELVSFEKTGFVAPTGKQFKEWSQGTTGKLVVSANGNLNFTAVYEDIPVAKYSVTYKAGDGQGNDYVVPNIEAGSKHALVTFAQSEFAAPDGQQFKGWQVGNDAELHDAGYEVTVNSDLTVTAIYEAKDWSDAQKEAMTTNVGLVLPYLGDDIAAAFTLNDSDPEDVYFEGEVDGNQLSSIYTAFNSAQWAYVWMNEETNNFFFTNPCSTGTAVFQCGAYKDSNNAIHTFFYYYFSFYRGIIETHASVEAYVGDSVSDLELQLALVNTEMQGSLISAENCEFSVDKFEEAGEVTVNVYYNYFYGSFKVNVKAVEATGLEIDYSNVKLSYEIGEEFDQTGLVATLKFNNGSTQDVSADVELSGFDSQTAGEKTITVTYGDFSQEFTVTVNEPAPVYDADAFAKDLLDLVAPICANYDGKKNNKAALKTVWDTMSQRYSTLSNEEKAKVIAAAAKTDGTDLEKAMAFYNYACNKYGLTKFIEGRQVKALVTEHETGNSILPIVVIVASSVAAITAIGVVIALKRRKALLAK